MKFNFPVLAATVLLFGPLAVAETTGTPSAPMDAIKASIQLSITKLEIDLVDIQVMFVHGTAVGKSTATGSRIGVSFTRVSSPLCITTSDYSVKFELTRRSRAEFDERRRRRREGRAGEAREQSLRARQNHQRLTQRVGLLFF